MPQIYKTLDPMKITHIKFEMMKDAALKSITHPLIAGVLETPQYINQSTTARSEPL